MFITLLILIFIRPFISSLAFPSLNYLYSISLLTFLIFWFCYKKISLAKLKSLKYPIILFSLALIISICFSQSKINSFEEFYKYAAGLSLFIIATSLNYKDRTRVIYTIILSALIISLLAIYQYLFGFQNLLDYIIKQGIMKPFALDYIERGRVFFPFVTPNILGGYIAMVIPLCLMNKNSVLFIIPLSIALLLTKSIGGLLSIYLGLVIYFYLLNKLKKKEILFLSGLLLITGLIFIFRTASQKLHTQPIFSTVMRLNYWEDTLKIIKVNILTGVGLGNFNLPQCRYVHNSYLQIWAEMGILGIISFLWLIITVFKVNLEALKDPYKKIQIVCLMTANIVFLIHNLIDFSFFLPEVSFIWWVILGL